MELKTLIEQVAQRLNIQNLQLNENGVCYLSFDNRLQVAIEAAPEPNIIFLYSVLCAIPTEGKDKLYETLMEGHLFGIGTRGGTFAASPKFGHIFFFKRFDLRDITLDSFLRELESFIQAYDFWKKRLDEDKS